MPAHRRLTLAGSLLAPVLLIVLLLAGRGRAPTAAAQDDLPPPPYTATWLPRATLPPYWTWRLHGDPFRRRLYAELSGRDEANNALAVYNIDTGALVGRLPYHVRDFHLTPGGERLYLVTDGRAGPPNVTIRRFDAATLKETGAITYTCAPVTDYCDVFVLAEGLDDRLYVLRKGGSYPLEVFDGNTGALLHTSTLNVQPGAGFNAIGHGDTLYVSSIFEDIGLPGIAVYDISDVVPARTDFHYMEDPPILVLSPDGAYLGAELSGSFTQFRAEPWQFLWRQPVMFLGYFAGGGPLVEDWRNDNSVLAALDPLTGAPVRGLIEHRHPEFGNWRAFAPLADGGVAILYNLGLELRRPVDYAVALPVLMNRACPGGPIVDRFTDPASGWPVRLIGPVTYDYTGDGYRIFLSQPDQWTAVTRGDVWNNADWVFAATNVPPGPTTWKYASVGLLYGLNDDWSDFYTFEVNIDHTTWYHFHYHDGAWEQLQTGRFNGWAYNWREVLQMRRNPYTGQVTLGVINQVQIDVADTPGRVGFAAGSFAPNVDVRLYHYEFHGENCDRAYRAAPLDVVPAPVARAHPPLE